MKAFASSMIASLALAQYGSYGSAFGSVRQDTGFGTTGHFGNKFGGPGIGDHDGNDHIYGFDSVKSRRDLKTAGDTRSANEAILGAVLTTIGQANSERVTYFTRVYERR